MSAAHGAPAGAPLPGDAGTGPRPWALPGAVLEHIMTTGLGRRTPTWLHVDADGALVELGGLPAEHGLAGLAPGDPVAARVSWLEGMLPAGAEPQLLPEVDTGERRADVHVWRADDGSWVLLLDATLRVAERERALERASHASYLREQLEGAVRGRRGARVERAEAFAALGAEILERDPNGGFRPQLGAHGGPPPWLDEVCEWAPGEERVVRADDPTSFLGAFLAEASEELDAFVPSPGTPRHVLRSGIWTQAIDGIESPFEAFAMVLSTGRRLLVVERLDLRYSERQDLLQRARETSLSFEALRRQVETKDVLLHCIVHDLRSPLASITGALSLLERQGGDDARRAELLELAQRQAERQESLIRAVLEVFSAEVEDLESFVEDAASAPDLRLVVREQVERARPAFQYAGIGLFAPEVGAPLPVVGRTDRLERVVSNLVDNALRHAPPGSAVEVRVVEDASGPALVVSDRGPGVPEVLRAALFERFVRGSRGGAAGLGLFYCRMTVERWGGHIEYRDREGGGAQFEVRLRRAGELSSPAPPSAPHRP